MANRLLFSSFRGTNVPKANSVKAGGLAYTLSAEAALAQYAATGCLNGSYYADASEHLETLLKLAAGVDDRFLAQTPVFCREEGFMKDIPAFLCAVLANRDVELLSEMAPIPTFKINSWRMPPGTTFTEWVVVGSSPTRVTILWPGSSAGRARIVSAILLERIKQAPRKPKDDKRLLSIIMNRACGPNRREFRSYCRLATRISTPEFKNMVLTAIPRLDLKVKGKLTFLLRYLEP